MFVQKRALFASLLVAAVAVGGWDFRSAVGQATVGQKPQQPILPQPIQGPRSQTGEVLIFGGDGQSASFFLLISPDRKKAWANSTEKGEWVKAPLRGVLPMEPPTIVGSQIAVIAEGRFVHAFSVRSGEWQTLELPEGANAVPSVGSDYAQVHTEQAVSIFSAQKGNWSTVKFVE